MRANSYVPFDHFLIISLFLYHDVGGDRMIYSGAVTKGESVVINTDQNTITVDGKVRADHILNQGNEHRIYFDEMPVTAQHVTVEETTVTRTNTAGN